MKSRVNVLKQKQLKNKLQAIRSIPQLKGIYTNVQLQNQTLRGDVLDLRYKVDLLLEKQKAKNSYMSAQDEAKTKEISSLQSQMKEQYKLMTELKKRKEHSQAEKGFEQVLQQVSNINNKPKTVEVHLSEAKIEVNDLRGQNQKLQKTLQTHEQQEKRNEPKIAMYTSQNAALRKKITNLRKLGNEKQAESVQIMNSKYSMKGKMTRYDELQKEIEIKKLSTSKPLIGKSKSQFINVDQLQKEVTELKKEMVTKQQQIGRSSGLAHRRKEQLMIQNKEEVLVQRDLEDKKARLLLELNKYKRIWTKYIEHKNNSKYLKEYAEAALQVDQFVLKQEPLRKEFAGSLGGKIRFDDRSALRQNLKSYIVGFMVYQLEHTASSKNSLVALRAIYDDPEGNAYNQVPLPGQFLSKCKLSKYMFMEGDFLKLFKVKYHAADSRILKIEIRSNKNSRYQFGDRRPFNDLNPGENVYGFDISIQEYPVCLFGSYNNIRSNWYMECLGVQINELPA